MSQPADKKPNAEQGGIDLGMLLITVLAILLLVLLWQQGQTLAFLITETLVIAIVLWQACDPFAEAAQWVGRTYRLPGSVRGATLDAIASSLPELFSGIFFVIVMAGRSSDQAVMAEVVGEGYGSTIATCAGSAIYNMILIPGVCALVIALRRRSRPVIDVERDVVWRDGLFFLVCEGLLLICLFQDTMHWWMGAAFVALYVLYIVKLQHDAGAYRSHYETVRQALDEMGRDTPATDVARALAKKGSKIDRATVGRIKHALRQGRTSDDPESEETEAPTSAGVFFRCCRVPLNRSTAWGILAAATGIAAVACYFLVEAVYATAEQLHVAPFFVAVILAAAASSLPDMFLSIGAARRGDDSGAISNAFGSNIFDICICLSVPLLLACYLNGWQPISLLQDGEPMAGLVGLRMLLWVLTLATLVIIWHRRQVTVFKGIVLCGLYCVFIAYAVLGSLGVPFFGYSL